MDAMRRAAVSLLASATVLASVQLFAQPSAQTPPPAIDDQDREPPPPTEAAAVGPEGANPAPPEPEPTAAAEAAPPAETPRPPPDRASAPPTSAYAPPGAPPPGLLPPPEVAAEPYSRRSAELIPQLGLAFPRCEAGETSSLNCNGVKVGGDMGFIALWRVSPYFAWGGFLDITALRYLPPDELDRNNAAAGSVYLGLIARLYPLQEGAVEPYLELGLGGGALATEFDQSDPITHEETRYEETGAGPAVAVGVGVDFYLGPHLRLGPFLAFTQVSVDKIRRCRSSGQGDCIDLAKDEDGYLDAYATAGARLTILLGDEL